LFGLTSSLRKSSQQWLSVTVAAWQVTLLLLPSSQDGHGFSFPQVALSEMVSDFV